MAHHPPLEGPGEPSTSAMLLSMDDFTDFKQIGKGKDSLVYSCTCSKLGSRSVVLKVYDKLKISPVKHRSVRREARIMKYLTHKRVPHVCDFIGAFQDQKQMYIVMEHAGGGDLLEQLLKEGRAMTEKRTVIEVVLPCLAALVHMHDLGIVHRDIKLENIFVDDAGLIQLGDFGLAVCMHEERAISPVGTLEYMSPEILRLPTTDLIVSGQIKAEDVTPINEKVDVWSFGVTVYELVTGRSPFEGADKAEIRQNILRANMRALPSFLTTDCHDFILQSLAMDPRVRPSAKIMLHHPWVLKHVTQLMLDSSLALVAAPPVYETAPSAPPTQAGDVEMGAAAAASPLADDSKLLDSSKAAGGHSGSPRSEGIRAYVPPEPQQAERAGSACLASVASSTLPAASYSSGSSVSMVSVADSASSLAGSQQGIGSKGGRAVSQAALIKPSTIEEGIMEAEFEDQQQHQQHGKHGKAHKGRNSKIGKMFHKMFSSGVACSKPPHGL